MTCSTCQKQVDQYEYLDLKDRVGWCSLQCIDAARTKERERIRQRRMEKFMIVYSRLPYSEEELMGVHLEI
jgi:hypothetical protein